MAQIISGVGTWVQITVENWLVLELTHSGLAMGVTNALQFGPSLVLGMYGGVVADRRDRRRVLMVIQTCLGLLALAVGLLAGSASCASGSSGLLPERWAWSKASICPRCKASSKDLVGPADLPNAVAWTNTISATGRMVAPMAGGLVLIALGVAPGFLINAASCASVTLAAMSSGERCGNSDPMFEATAGSFRRPFR